MMRDEEMESSTSRKDVHIDTRSLLLCSKALGIYGLNHPHSFFCFSVGQCFDPGVGLSEMHKGMNNQITADQTG